VTEALPHVLRVSGEPFRYISEAETHALLTADPGGYLAFVRGAMAAIAAGRAQVTIPPKQVFTDSASGGDFRVMPCELRWGTRVIKTVKVVGTNTVQRKVPDQITVGKLFILDPEENFISAVLEGCLLSSARTGACAAIAITTLSRACKQLVIVGSGRVGFYAAFYAVNALAVERVIFCDVVHERAQAAAQWFSSKFNGVRFEALPITAIESADVVVLATASRSPIVSPPCWGANLIVSLGADIDTQSELDPAWARFAEVYCDTLDSLRFGDLRAWTEAGQVEPAAIMGLVDVLRNPPPESGRARVFVSTGSALFDNLTAGYLIESEPSRL